jgi:hypothetical protein
MIKRNTLILLAVMIIMIGGFILLDQKGWVDFAMKKDQTPTPSPLLFDMDTNNVDSVSYNTVNSNKVVIQRTEDNNWSMDFKGGIVTAGIVEQIISNLNSLKPIAVLEIAPEGSATGLDDPTHILSIKLINGIEHVIKIGNINPLQSGFYVQIDFGKVVLINKGSIESLLAIIQNAQYPLSPTPIS